MAQEQGDAAQTAEDVAFVGCVAGNLRAAARVATRAYDAALRETGLRITQVAILARLRQVHPVTVSELAMSLACERSAMARDLAVLQREGLVEIEVKAEDRRAREVRLTRDGDRLLQHCAPAWRAAQRSMADVFGDGEVRQLVHLSSRLVAAVGAPAANLPGDHAEP